MAEHADEWNTTRVTVEEYAAKRAVLAGHCRAVRRDPAAIRDSLMIPVITGRTPAEVAARLAGARAIFPRVPEDAAGWRAAGFLYGLIDEVRHELKRWDAAGMSRVMLQLLDMDDLDAIRLIAREAAVAAGLRQVARPLWGRRQPAHKPRRRPGRRAAASRRGPDGARWAGRSSPGRSRVARARR